MPEISCDVCVIGGGSGGLSVAAGAAQMGADTVLFERSEMGGDCLNTGCVPSKALLSAAKAAHAFKGAEAKGIKPSSGKHVDFAQVNAHIHDIIASIAPHDSVERFEGLGVNVIQAEAHFTSNNTVSGTDHSGTHYQVTARYFVIATGSHPWVPPVTGIKDTEYLTNETIFSLTECPEHLVIIGGGPIGIEMAQAHRRLGARVSVVDVGPVMFRDDQEIVSRLKHQLEAEGIDFYENIKIEKITAAENKTGEHVSDAPQAGAVIELESGEFLVASHLLVAVGRRPNLASLDLEKAGVKFNEKGIITDNRLRSSNKRIFAIGDVAGRHQFTHMAAYHASIVVQNMLFKLPVRCAEHAVPWVTYTDPEMAQAGLTLPQARQHYKQKEIRVTDWELKDNDRARAERRTDGMIRVITSKKGQVLGATILAPHAGEMIHIWTLAIQKKMNISAVARTIAPYPSYAEANKRAAGAFFTDQIFSPRVVKIVRFLMRLTKR